MSKFRNESGGVLTVSDLGIRVGPGEKFDWPDHDIEVHGLPTGCTWLDAPKPKDGTAKDAAKDAAKAPEGDAAATETPDDKTAAKRGKTAGHDKEAGA